jgi:hypothetical protein
VVSAQAATLVVDSDGFRLAYKLEPTLTDPFQLLDYQSSKAIAGEEWHDVLLARRSDADCVIRVTEYAAVTGAAGFNDRTRSGAAKFLDALFSDAWTWHRSRQQFVSFPSMRASLDRPGAFPWLSCPEQSMSAPYSMLCYHGPKAALQSEMDDLRPASGGVGALSVLYGSARGPQKLRALLDVCSRCELVSVWSADARRLRTISSKDKLVVQRMSDACKDANLSFELVEREELLPIW